MATINRRYKGARTKKARSGNTRRTLKKTASIRLKEYFESKSIVFYERIIREDIVMFLVPYNFEKQKIRLDLQIIVFETKNLCRMSFYCELDTSKDNTEKIAQINDLVEKGIVETDSDQIKYTVVFSLEKKSNVEEVYNKNFELCIMVLANLYQEHIMRR